MLLKPQLSKMLFTLSNQETGIDHEEFYYTYIYKEWVIACYLYHVLTLIFI